MSNLNAGRSGNWKGKYKKQKNLIIERVTSVDSFFQSE